MVVRASGNGARALLLGKLLQSGHGGINACADPDQGNDHHRPLPAARAVMLAVGADSAALFEVKAAGAQRAASCVLRGKGGPGQAANTPPGQGQRRGAS